MPGGNGIIGPATSTKDPGMSQALEPVVLTHPKKQARLAKEAPKPEVVEVKTEPKEAPAQESTKETSASVEADRAERGAAFKELEKATKLKQEAAQLNASNANFLKLRDAFNNNPTYDNIAALAKELGQTPEQFIATTDRIRMGMPTTPNLTPDQIKERDAKEWQAKMDAKQQEIAKLVDDNTKQNYVFNRIFPKINDKDKFELLHDEGIEKMSVKIYDYMNNHYQATKEELDIGTVAQMFEDELFDHATKMAARFSKLKKLNPGMSNKKLTAMAEDIEGEPTILAKTKPNLGDQLTPEDKEVLGDPAKVDADATQQFTKKPRRVTDADPYSVASNNTVRTKSMFDRNARMKKVTDKFGTSGSVE